MAAGYWFSNYFASNFWASNYWHGIPVTITPAGGGAGGGGIQLGHPLVWRCARAFNDGDPWTVCWPVEPEPELPPELPPPPLERPVMAERKSIRPPGRLRFKGRSAGGVVMPILRAVATRYATRLTKKALRDLGQAGIGELAAAMRENPLDDEDDDG